MSETRLSFSLPSKPGEASVLPATKSSPLAHQSDPTRPHSPPYLWNALKISRIRCWIVFIGVLHTSFSCNWRPPRIVDNSLACFRSRSPWSEFSHHVYVLEECSHFGGIWKWRLRENVNVMIRRQRSTFERGYIGLLQLVLSGVMMHLVDVIALMKQKHKQNKKHK